MGEANIKVDAVTTVSAVIKRADGTIEDLGVVASSEKGNVVTKPIDKEE